MMERRPPPPLLIVILLLISYIGSGRGSGGSTTTTSSHSPTPNPSPAAPAPTPPTADSSPTSSTLDPKQLSALQSIGLTTARDPCAQPSPHDNATACDSAAPFRHLISLRLANCSPDIDLSPTALRALSTLRSLSFLRCPIPPPKRLPSPLADSLRSFSCVTSLRRLTGVWLSRLHNLTALTVIDVPIAASGPLIVISGMPNLRSLTISRANLSGALPHHWRPLGLSRIDLSANRLRGPIPGSISLLGSLESLNLSSNALTGPLPDSIGDLVSLKNVSFSNNSLSGPIPDSLSGLSALAHLDLSSNQFNGSIPRFLSELKGLGYLNLQDNNFQGVIPFNGTFIKKLEVFKVGGNNNLCYNRTLLSSKLALGIAPCDKYGLPLSPPPERSTDSGSSDGSGDDGSSDNGGGGNEKGGGGHHGPSKLVLGVAIALACLVFLVIFIVCLSKVCG